MYVILKNFKKCIAFSMQCDMIQSNETNTHCCCAIANTINKCIIEMKTKYINDYIDDFNNVHLYELLNKIDELCKFKFYHVANNMINELYNIENQIIIYENVNYNLFVMTFDEKCKYNQLLKKIKNMLTK